jgi:hypothetical protein
MTTLTEREEELLSYLVGLAPVGQEVQCRRIHVLADLEITHPAYFSRDIKSLVIAKAIKVLGGGASYQPLALIVLQRPEAFKVARTYKPNRLVKFAGYDAREAA